MRRQRKTEANHHNRMGTRFITITKTITITMEETIEKIKWQIEEALSGYGNLDKVEILRSVINGLSVKADAYLMEEYNMVEEEE